MAYIKRDWDNTGTEVTKEDFKRMESGIEANEQAISEHTDQINDLNMKTETITSANMLAGWTLNSYMQSYVLHNDKFAILQIMVNGGGTLTGNTTMANISTVPSTNCLLTITSVTGKKYNVWLLTDGTLKIDSNAVISNEAWFVIEGVIRL